MVSPEYSVIPKSACELVIHAENDSVKAELNVFMAKESKFEFIGKSDKEVELFYTMNCYHVLWYHIEKFCLHAMVIWNSGQLAWPHELKKAIQRCDDMQQWIQYNQYNLLALCNNTINMKNYLTTVLPPESYASYSHCKQKLELIIETALSIKKQLKTFENTLVT